MAKYNVTYACGHEGVVNIVGPYKNREWKRQREENKMCPDCWRKRIEEERARENEEAAKKAAEMELPELTGTPKQVAWANTLRQKMINAFDKITCEEWEGIVDYYDFYNISDVKFEDLERIKNYILTTKTNASYFIDTRYDKIIDIVEREKGEALKSDEEKALDEEAKRLEKEAQAEATVFPNERETDAVVEITFNDKEVRARFERNEQFRLIVRGLGYRWDGSAWVRKISARTGSAEDRAAELGNRLLNEGFPIRIYDESVRESAVTGNFEPEHKRWIARLKEKDRFAIIWTDGSDMYRTARSLPGSKWERPFMTVSVERYTEVQEFAELYDFKLTPGAIEMIEEHLEATKKAEVVDPAKVENVDHKDGLKEILESGDEIIDDLKD